MNRKLSLLLAAASCYGMMGNVYATHSSPSATPSCKPFHFYAGLSGGVNRMTGRRSENVFVVPTREVVTFTDNLNFKDTNAQYSGFAGFSWLIPHTGIFIGPEVHLGKSHTESKFQAIIRDPLAADQRTLNSTFSQSTFFGAVARVGYKFSSYSIYAVLGAESSQFFNTVTYVPFGPTSPAFFKSKKWLKAFLWGFGLEKQINCVRFGAEVRATNYGQYKVNYSYPAANETINNLFKTKNIRFSLRVSYLF